MENNLNIVIIIQARMSSTRLPGKVLLPLHNKTVLDYVCSRSKKVVMANEVIVATSVDVSDDKIEMHCIKNKYNVFRGSLDDVLDRYYKAAKKYNADVIVRITADCPFIDYVIVNKMVKKFINSNNDYYYLGGNFPDGLDCSIIRFQALEKAYNEAYLKSDREHVCPYIEKNNDIFNIDFMNYKFDLYNYRWTLDHDNDYIFLKETIAHMEGDKEFFLSDDIIATLKKFPNLLDINKDIFRNEGYLISLKNDKRNI